MTLDTKALEAAREAAVTSWHSDDMSFETALAKAIEAYLSQAATPSRNDILEEAARVADERAQMREQLFNENGASLNASKAVEAEEIAAAIRALVKP